MCNDKRPNGLKVIGNRQFFNWIFSFRAPFFMVRRWRERNMQTKWKTFGRFIRWIAVAFRLRLNFKENTFLPPSGQCALVVRVHEVKWSTPTEPNRWAHESNSSFDCTRGTDEIRVWLNAAHYRRCTDQCECIFAPQALSYVARAHAMCPNE